MISGMPRVAFAPALAHCWSHAWRPERTA